MLLIRLGHAGHGSAMGGYCCSKSPSGILTNAAGLMYFCRRRRLAGIHVLDDGQPRLRQPARHQLVGWCCLTLGWRSAGRGGTATTAAWGGQARLMGLNVDSMRCRLVLAVCLLTGVAVSLCGVIRLRRPGSASPAARRAVGGDRGAFLLPASALGVAPAARGADLVARSALHAGELPSGVITASVGALSPSICCWGQDAVCPADPAPGG